MDPQESEATDVPITSPANLGRCRHQRQYGESGSVEDHVTAVRHLACNLVRLIQPARALCWASPFVAMIPASSQVDLVGPLRVLYQPGQAQVLSILVVHAVFAEGRKTFRCLQQTLSAAIDCSCLVCQRFWLRVKVPRGARDAPGPSLPRGNGVTRLEGKAQTWRIPCSSASYLPGAASCSR